MHDHLPRANECLEYVAWWACLALCRSLSSYPSLRHERVCVLAPAPRPASKPRAETGRKYAEYTQPTVQLMPPQMLAPATFPARACLCRAVNISVPNTRTADASHDWLVHGHPRASAFTSCARAQGHAKPARPHSSVQEAAAPSMPRQVHRGSEADRAVTAQARQYRCTCSEECQDDEHSWH